MQDIQPTKKEIELSDREIELILFIRNELPFGDFKVVTHCGEPVKYKNLNPTGFFKGIKSHIKSMNEELKSTNPGD